MKHCLVKPFLGSGAASPWLQDPKREESLSTTSWPPCLCWHCLFPSPGMWR